MTKGLGKTPGCVVKPIPQPGGVSRDYRQNHLAFMVVCDGYDEIGWIHGHTERRHGKKVTRVQSVDIDSAYARQGNATALYEALAAAACRRRAPLVSDERTSGAHSHAFWRKQHTKKRAKIIGENSMGPVYQLMCSRAGDLSGLAETNERKELKMHRTRATKVKAHGAKAHVSHKLVTELGKSVVARAICHCKSETRSSKGAAFERCLARSYDRAEVRHATCAVKKRKAAKKTKKTTKSRKRR